MTLSKWGLGDAYLRILADPDLNVKIRDMVTLQINTRKAQFFDPKTELSLLW